MPTPEEHLRQDVGAHLSSLLFQLAMLKAEIDRLKAELESGARRMPVDDHVPRER